MSVTQVYKKPKDCCSFDCQQGRLCPLQPEADSMFVSAVCMVAGVLLLTAPFILWAWGV